LRQNLQYNLTVITVIGEGYENVIVPAIPASDLVVTKTTDGSHLPPLLQAPLIKCTPEHPQQKYKGVQSGRRSALIKINNKLETC
jgi:hypothetical protein